MIIQFVNKYNYIIDRICHGWLNHNFAYMTDSDEEGQPVANV